MAFSEEEKVKIRYYCGYGALGQQMLPANGYRFFTEYGEMEYKLINCQPQEEDQIKDFYLPSLDLLRNDIIQSRLNNDTSRAAVWFRNPKELSEKIRVFNYTRLEMCNFLGLFAGPYLGGRGISFVV